MTDPEKQLIPAPVDPMSISSRLKLLEVQRDITTGQINALSDKIDVNTAATNDIKKNTDELVDLFRAGTVVIGFFRGCGVVAKWFGSIGISLALLWGLIYAFIHGGPPPNIK